MSGSRNILQRIKESFQSGEISSPQKYELSDSVNIDNDSLLKGNVIVGEKAEIRKSLIEGEVVIGNSVKLFGPLEIHGGSQIEIGRHSSLNGPGLNIFSKINPVRIGKFCSIARNVTIQEYNHNSKRPSSYFMNRHFFSGKMTDDIVSKDSIEIGHDVWIGAGACILSGSKIGTGSIIGANSVVSGVIEPYSVVVGNPSNVLKSRFEDAIIQKLLEIEWWNWSDDKIMRNSEFFNEKLSLNSFESIVD